jgi:CheY-like chemotaxis protein
VAIGLAARTALYSPFIRHVKSFYSLLFRLHGRTGLLLETLSRPTKRSLPAGRYTGRGNKGTQPVEQVGILLVDDDITSQQALKSVLDSEGWRVRIVPKASDALAELATGIWNLAIVNVALADPGGPLFAILRELAQAPLAEPNPTITEESPNEPPPPSRRIRVLFLVPLLMAKDVQPILEREGLPHSPKPYHLHEFLERVSELLLESGAITEQIRGVGGFAERKVRRRSQQRFGRGTRAGAMFAPRDDYHMTEEEMNEWEREEEAQRKKRQKDQPPGSSF